MIKPVIDNNKLIGVVEEENIITLSTIGNLNDFTEPYQDGFYYVPATGYCEYVAVFNGEVHRGFFIESVFMNHLMYNEKINFPLVSYRYNTNTDSWDIIKK